MENNKVRYTTTQVMNMFNITVTKNAFYGYEERGIIPKAERVERGKTSVRTWTAEDLPVIGEKLGYLKKPVETTVISFFTQKGGTGKTPLAFQFARTAALHNIRVLVIGLDSQETITNILKGSNESDSLPDNLDDLYSEGLLEAYKAETDLFSTIMDTDLPTLKFIPENAGLAALETDLNHEKDPINAFEKHFFSKLRESGRFDYIICDCNPSWGRIINSVLNSTDLLVSPLKCDASTLTTTKTFFGILDEFEQDLEIDIPKFIIPTLLENNKLSRQVLSYYETKFSADCSKTPLKKTVIIDEAQVLQKSVMEHSPASPIFKDLISVFEEIEEVVSELNDEEVIEELSQPETKVKDQVSNQPSV